MEELEEIEQLILAQRADQQIDRRVLIHIVRQLNSIHRNQEKIMTDLSGLQQDETDLAAALATASADQTAAFAALDAEIAGLTVGAITQAQIDALRAPLADAKAAAQALADAAVAATPPAAPAP